MSACACTWMARLSAAAPSVQQGHPEERKSVCCSCANHIDIAIADASTLRASVYLREEPRRSLDGIPVECARGLPYRVTHFNSPPQTGRHAAFSGSGFPSGTARVHTSRHMHGNSDASASVCYGVSWIQRAVPCGSAARTHVSCHTAATRSWLDYISHSTPNPAINAERSWAAPPPGSALVCSGTCRFRTGYTANTAGSTFISPSCAAQLASCIMMPRAGKDHRERGGRRRGSQPPLSKQVAQLCDTCKS